MSERIRLLLFILIALASIYTGSFAFDDAHAVRLFRDLGYYTIGLTVGLFVYFILRAYPPSWAGIKQFFNRREVLLGLVVALAGMVFLLREEPIDFKTVMDEHTLASTSKQLHESRKVEAITRYMPINQTLVPLRGFVDKRPILYPFLVSVVHDLTGYRPLNGVYLNTLLTPVLLFLLYYMVLGFSNWKAATATVALFVSLPLLSYMCAGGGLEPVNLLFLVLTCFLGGLYLEKPNADRLGAFALSGILLAQCRYESVIFILIVGAIIVWPWLHQRRMRLYMPLLICPPLLIPYLWQNRVFQVKSRFWQIDELGNAEKPFGAEYMYDNFGRAVGFFFDFSLEVPNSWLLSVLGLLALLLFGVSMAGKLRSFPLCAPRLQAVILFLAGLFILFILLLSYAWDFDAKVIRRLSLPLHLPLAVAGGYLLFEYISNRCVHRFASLGLLLYFFAYALPATSQRLYSHDYIAGGHFDAARNFLEQHKSLEKVVIAENAAFFHTFDVPTLATGLANRRKEAIRFYIEQPLSMPVFYFERLVYQAENEDFQNTAKTQLDAAFITEPFWEETLSAVRKVRISRIVDVEGVEFEKKAYESTDEYLKEWGANLP
ncbi:MAG: hypothetical protein ACLFU4_02090 [Opitutales bacterium]